MTPISLPFTVISGPLHLYAEQSTSWCRAGKRKHWGWAPAHCKDWVVYLLWSSLPLNVESKWSFSLAALLFGLQHLSDNLHLWPIWKEITKSCLIWRDSQVTMFVLTVELLVSVLKNIFSPKYFLFSINRLYSWRRWCNLSVPHVTSQQICKCEREILALSSWPIESQKLMVLTQWHASDHRSRLGLVHTRHLCVLELLRDSSESARRQQSEIHAFGPLGRVSSWGFCFSLYTDELPMFFFVCLFRHYTILHLESLLSLKKNRFADLKHIFSKTFSILLYILAHVTH